MKIASKGGEKGTFFNMYQILTIESFLRKTEEKGLKIEIFLCDDRKKGGFEPVENYPGSRKKWDLLRQIVRICYVFWAEKSHYGGGKTTMLCFGTK